MKEFLSHAFLSVFVVITLSACGGAGGSDSDGAGGNDSGGAGGSGSDGAGGSGSDGAGGSDSDEVVGSDEIVSGDGINGQRYVSRLKEIEYDLDTNGVADAIEIYTYDDDGRLESISYEYMGDGTPDNTVQYFSKFSERFDTTYDYDSEGRLISTELIAAGGDNPERPLNSPAATFLSEYEYDSSFSFPSKVTNKTYNQIGALVSDIHYEYTYSDDRWVRRDYFSEGAKPERPGFENYRTIEYTENYYAVTSFDYLDRPSSGQFVIMLNANGLISKMFGTTAETVLEGGSVPNSTSFVEIIYTDRGCVEGMKSGSKSDSGEISYSASYKTTFDSSDLPIETMEYSDNESVPIAIRSYNFERISGALRPVHEQNIDFYFRLQGLETDCRYD